MDHALGYSFRVWLTTAVIASVLTWLSNFLYVTGFDDIATILAMLIGLPFLVFFIGIFTVPCAIILYFSVQYLLKRKVSATSIKIILTILGAFLVYTYLHMLSDFKLRTDHLLKAVPFFGAIIISVWVHKLRRFTVDYRVSES